jgi:hypothetical protein
MVLFFCVPSPKFHLDLGRNRRTQLFSLPASALGAFFIDSSAVSFVFKLSGSITNLDSNYNPNYLIKKLTALALDHAVSTHH